MVDSTIYDTRTEHVNHYITDAAVRTIEKSLKIPTDNYTVANEQGQKDKLRSTKHYI